MKNINETMRNLQQATERISKLNWGNSSNPWGALSQMQDIFNQDFWSNIAHVTQYQQEQAQQSKAQPQARMAKKNPVDEVFSQKIPIDIFETLSKIIICCEMPGLDRNSLKVSLSHSTELSIKGKIKGHDLSDYRISHERFSGKFTREIQLPSAVTVDGVLTTYKDGLLEIQLSKFRPEEKWKDIKEVKFDL